MNEYYVYIMSSWSKVLYTGVTNDLERRVLEHKQGTSPGFSDRYRCTRLVWHESFTDVNQAIECEKRIKGWTRAKKIALIESMNVEWSDLSGGWFEKSDPSLRSG
jgi:putative endonuclease